MTTAVIIICVIVFIVFFVQDLANSDDGPSKSRRVSNRSISRPKIKLRNEDGDPWMDSRNTYIAGLSYYATKRDVGGFWGYVVNEPDNKVDPKAMAVITVSGKLLGYIPAKELKEYRDWCNGMPRPCVGFLYVHGDQLRGRAKILDVSSREFLEREFANYLSWVRSHMGERYLPKENKMPHDFE